MCFSAAQSAESIAVHFSKISQEYDPLQLSSLPPNIRNYITEERSVVNAQSLSVYNVRKRILKAKKPLGVVPGDLPRKIVKNYIDNYFQ